MKLRNFGKLSFGNIIEWYDFSLYIYFACFIANDFFPVSTPEMKMLLAFSTFFIGSLARPVGGVVSGWLSDKYHGATVINYCVIAMGVSTLLMAFLPTYQQIGITAPLLLTLLRVVQGLSAGGQMPNLIALSASQYRQQSAMAIGFSFSISSIGFLLASLLGFVLTQYFSMLSTALLWRGAFATSALLFVSYLLLNRKNDFDHSEVPVPVKRPSLWQGLKQQYCPVIAVVLLTTMCSSMYFLVFTYLINYQIEILHYPHEQAFILNSVVLIIACIAYPLFGYCADKIGQSRLYWLAVILLGVALVPSIKLIQAPTANSAMIGLTTLALLTVAIQAGVSPLFAQLFKPEWRATGCAFSYSVGNAIGGGAPLIALSLVQVSPHYGLDFMMVALMLLGSLGMLIARWAPVYMEGKQKRLVLENAVS